MITRDNRTAKIEADAGPSNTANFVWLTVLVLAGVAGSLVISCVTPFVALAVALAGTVRLSTALRAMTLFWLTNQAIGFVFFSFPRTSNVVLWGLAGGAGALISTLVAATAIKRTQSWSTIARLSLALLLGFAAYESILFAAGFFLGGVGMFSPAVIAQLGLSNAVWFAVMVGLNESAVILCQSRFGKLPRLARAT